VAPRRLGARWDLVLACCAEALPRGTEAAGPRAVAPYVPRAAADTVLHGVIREHLETFLAAAAAPTDGVGLPRFIEHESAASSAVDCSSMAFCGSGATTARSSASCPCPARAARYAPLAAGGAWRSRRRISSARSSLGSRSGNG